MLVTFKTIKSFYATKLHYLDRECTKILDARMHIKVFNDLICWYGTNFFTPNLFVYYLNLLR
jgi:hypothetical protein